MQSMLNIFHKIVSAVSKDSYGKGRGKLQQPEESMLFSSKYT